MLKATIKHGYQTPDGECARLNICTESDTVVYTTGVRSLEQAELALLVFRAALQVSNEIKPSFATSNRPQAVEVITFDPVLL